VRNEKENQNFQLAFGNFFYPQKVRRNANAIGLQKEDIMAIGKEIKFRGSDQKGRGVLKRLFLWSPSVDTVIAFLSVILITSLVCL